jgi:membrane fusion protein (multidrug efflux system)
LRRPPSLLLLAGFVLSCARPAHGPESGSTPPPAAPVGTGSKEPVLVRVRPATRGPIELRLEATANVESLDVVDIVSERAEPVVAVLVEEGDRVAAGQPLARLREDQAQLALQEAEVRLAETQLATLQAQRDHERNQRLWEEGGGTPRLIAEQALETSRQAWDAAKSAAAAAAVAKERAEWELGRCTLCSPIAGTVTARDLSLGDMAAVGQRAFQIADLSTPRLIFHRPQRELDRLREGQALTATSEALPGRTIPGVLERVSPLVDATTGTVKVIARLQPGETALRIGILMRLVLVLERRPAALLIPREALLYEGGSAYVFVVRDGRARRVQVEAGFEDPTHLEAAAGTDLAEGDALVVVGGDRLADGDPVEVAQE